MVYKKSELKNKKGEVILTWEKSIQEPDLSFLQNLNIKKIATPKLKKKQGDDSKLVMFPLADLHYGELVYKEEVNHRNNWDTKIFNKIFTKLFTELISISPDAKTALIVNLGDFLHSPDNDNVTKASHHSLDVDGRFCKIYKEAMSLWVWMIDSLLKKYNNVYIISVEGNHDVLFNTYLKTYLDGYYRNEPRVSVQEGDRIHCYYKFNDILLGFTHGHTIKYKRFPEIMIYDNMKYLSHINFRYAFSGHLHHSIREETTLAVNEVLGNFPVNDFWAESAGYRSKAKFLTSITYEKGKGEIQRNTIC